MVATESHGLLEVEESEDSIRPRRERYHHGPSPAVSLGIIILLVACVAGAVLVVFKSASDHGPLTPERQVAFLNDETEKARPSNLHGCKSTLLLMRHCEKRGEETSDSMGNQHCSDIGSERAEYIKTLFGDDGRWSLPAKLYAMSRGRPGVHHLNYREIETLSPLKEKSGVGIDTRYTDGNERGLAGDFFSILSRGELCGKTTVVNWKHSRIPKMAMALGCGHGEGCPSKYHKKEFDKMWELKYSYSDADSAGSSTGKRRMKNSSQNKSKTNGGHWTVSGSVVSEGFQPSLTQTGSKETNK